MKQTIYGCLLLSVCGWGQQTSPAPDSSDDDDRGDFEASAYLGLAVDTFTAQVQREILYGNPQDNGTKRERMIGGFNFAYRLSGDPSSPKRPQLWIYGETLHGVRSSEVDCTDTTNRPPVCAISDNVFNSGNAATAGKQLVYLLRNASSLEAHAGFRFEFLPLNPRGKDAARLYFKAEAGFLSIAQSGGDVFDAHHIGLGAIATKGRFESSYLEVGYGRNDVFRVNRYRRAIVAGYLAWGSDRMRELGFRPFVEMFVDTDAGRGADSVQTFIGMNFDLDKIFSR